MQLVKFKGRFAMRQSIQSLLRELGMSSYFWDVENFWYHFRNELDFILVQANKLYKTHARHVHPRLIADDQERARNLNVLWNEIQSRFRARMQPKSLMPREERYPGGRKAAQKEWQKRNRHKRKRYRSTPESLAKHRVYSKNFRAKPENREKKRLYDKRRLQKIRDANKSLAVA
jgi:hypothetical protein